MVPRTKDTNEFAAIAQDKKEFLFKFVLAQGYKFCRAAVLVALCVFFKSSLIDVRPRRI